jgi:Amt family ammonium transporter
MKDGFLTTGHTHLLGVQALGTLTVIVWGLVAGYVMAKVCEWTVGLRSNIKDEEEGLDMAYHGIPAYNDLERFADIPSSLFDFEESTGATVKQIKKND